jgi:hypothetical protein
MFRVLTATKASNAPQRPARPQARSKSLTRAAVLHPSTADGRMGGGSTKAITDIADPDDVDRGPLRQSRDGVRRCSSRGPVKPDLAPKKMSGSFCQVCMILFSERGKGGRGATATQTKNLPPQKEILLMEL